eukprot:1153425-Pelagomonas_calceolata.AAC.1
MSNLLSNWLHRHLHNFGQVDHWHSTDILIYGRKERKGEGLKRQLKKARNGLWDQEKVKIDQGGSGIAEDPFARETLKERMVFVK